MKALKPIRSNRIMSVEEAMRIVESMPDQEPVPQLNLDDYLLLENISCTNTHKYVFDAYEKILVSKKPISHKFVGAISECIKPNEFFASFALMTNIVIALANDQREEYQDLFYQIVGTGYVGNTIIDLEKEIMRHKTEVGSYRLPTPGLLANGPSGSTTTKAIPANSFLRNLAGIKDTRYLTDVMPVERIQVSNIYRIYDVAMTPNHVIRLDVNNDETLSVYPVIIPTNP